MEINTNHKIWGHGTDQIYHGDGEQGTGNGARIIRNRIKINAIISDISVREHGTEWNVGVAVSMELCMGLHEGVTEKRKRKWTNSRKRSGSGMEWLCCWLKNSGNFSKIHRQKLKLLVLLRRSSEGRASASKLLRRSSAASELLRRREALWRRASAELLRRLLARELVEAALRELRSRSAVRPSV